MTERSDQDWFEALAGRTPGDAEPLATKEAEALRRAMRAARESEPAPDLDVEAGVQRLLFRLRQERLTGGETRRRSWRMYSGLALAASLVLAVGIVVFQGLTVTDEWPVLRGGDAQVLKSAAPGKLGAAIRADLEAAGLSTRIVEFGTTVTLEADWPARPSPAQLEAVKRHSLKPPSGTRLRVEIRGT